MVRSALELSKYIDDNDFIKRKTNTYAKINDNYYLRVNERVPEEVTMLEDVFNFYFCRVRKIGDKSYKEEAVSRNYVIAEEVMNASDFIKGYDENSPIYQRIAIHLYYYGDFSVCLNYFEDGDETIKQLVSPLLKGDQLIMKNKTLRLAN